MFQRRRRRPLLFSSGQHLWKDIKYRLCSPGTAVLSLMKQTCKFSLAVWQKVKKGPQSWWNSPVQLFFFLSFIYFFCFSLTLWCQEVKVIVGSLPYYRKRLEGTAAVNWHYINETDLELNLVKSILIMILTPSLSHSKMGELKKRTSRKKTGDGINSNLTGVTGWSCGCEILVCYLIWLELSDSNYASIPPHENRFPSIPPGNS